MEAPKTKAQVLARADVPDEFRSSTPSQLRALIESSGDKFGAAACKLLSDAAAEIEGGEEAFGALIAANRELRERHDRIQRVWHDHRCNTPARMSPENAGAAVDKPISVKPSIFQLTAPPSLHPAWMGKFSSGKHPSSVEGGGVVSLGGQQLVVQGDAPLPGLQVLVWLNEAGFFVCADADHVRAIEAQYHEAETQKQEHRRAEERNKRNALRDEAKAFNDAIKLPVRWEVGIKDVLAGLSATSWGDGRNKATVEHIHLLEDLNAGRLIRRAGDLLCTAKSGSNGQRYSGVVTSGALDGDGEAYSPKVTCKACIKLAGTFIEKLSEKD